MTSPAIELQKAVFAALGTDAGLIAALGGERIHDHAPANVAFPYITFGRTSAYDWATGTEDGNEHLFTLHVWSKAKGKAETLAIMELARRALHDRDLALEGHRLVNLRAEFEEARYDEDLAVHHGLLRFRAVTEPQ
jgi:hypothetical protein